MKLSRAIYPALGALSLAAEAFSATTAGTNAVKSLHLPISGDFFDSAKNFEKIIPQSSKCSIWGPLPETYETFHHRLKDGTPTIILPQNEQFSKQAAEQEFIQQHRKQANQYIDQYGYGKYLQACESVAYYVREALKPPGQKNRFEEVVHSEDWGAFRDQHLGLKALEAKQVEANRAFKRALNQAGTTRYQFERLLNQYGKPTAKIMAEVEKRLATLGGEQG